VADSFKIIGITLPDLMDNEAWLICHALDCGIDRIHLRKPLATASQMEDIISQIPQRLHARLSVHSHHQLVERFPDLRIHLNARNPLPPVGLLTPFSRSCHSFEELTAYPRAEYSFLSPIFDSISKSGYSSAFTAEALERASRCRIINSSVIALGGVVPEYIPRLIELGFGGAAMLGCLWADLNLETIKKRIDAAIHYSQKR